MVLYTTAGPCDGRAVVDGAAAGPDAALLCPEPMAAAGLFLVGVDCHCAPGQHLPGMSTFH